jgi:acetyl esterase/lipase
VRGLRRFHYRSLTRTLDQRERGTDSLPHRTSLAGGSAGAVTAALGLCQGCHGYPRHQLVILFSPGSFPSFAACSISALISPPIKIKKPLRYIQVRSTITVPMLP